MAQMATAHLAPKMVYSAPASDPKKTFERAIAQIRCGETVSKPSQTPIAVRRRTVMEIGQDNEKQALTNAARALAQLWNVRPTLVR